MNSTQISNRHHLRDSFFHQNPSFNAIINCSISKRMMPYINNKPPEYFKSTKLLELLLSNIFRYMYYPVCGTKYISSQVHVFIGKRLQHSFSTIF